MFESGMDRRPISYTEADRLEFLVRHDPYMCNEESAAIRALEYRDWWIDMAIALGG